MTIRVGVIGVGSMGKHHARVYDEIPSIDLVGVTDVDEEAAQRIAAERGTNVYSREALLERVDAVSIAVPTAYHYDTARECIANGVNLLVEKPFVDDPTKGEELVERAADAGVVLQVGHIERFNPAVLTLQEVMQGLDIISIEARRLGPTPDRQIDDSVVTDLMIHDLDIVRSLLGDDPEVVQAVGSRAGKHATATLSFPDETIATCTASRVTQEKVRTLTITAEERYIKVDYLNQSVEIHRQSVPEYVVDDGDVRYRHESIVERPVVTNSEPLKNELTAFISAVKNGDEPAVTGEQGVMAVRLAQGIDKQAFPERYR